MRTRYQFHDDAQWPDLPDVAVMQDEGGGAFVVHDLAERDRRILAEHEIAEAETLALLKRQLADTQDRLHDPFFPFFPVR